MTIKIESMKKSDLEEVIEVQKKSFSLDLREELAVFIDRFNKFGESFLVAKKDERIVGYAICFPWKLGEIPENNRVFPAELPIPDSFYLHDICLLEETRGLGIAGKILEKIYEKAKASGYSEVSLVSVEQSGNYWDRNGFELVNVGEKLKEKLVKSYGIKARLMNKKLA